MNNCPILIVGMGLAGSLLALELMDREQAVIIIDASESVTASRMATGIINPVTGLRLTKTAGVDQLLPVALMKYRALSHRYGMVFYHPETLVRLFQSSEEAMRWQSRAKDSAYAQYLEVNEQSSLKDIFFNSLDLRYGYGLHKHSGYLETAKLLDSVKAELVDRNVLQIQKFNPASIRFEKDNPFWQGQLIKKIVFCEGFQAQQNPWFSWLPFQPVKGEVVTLEVRDKTPSYILNKKISVIPKSSGSMKVGSTYEWSNNTKPSDKAKKQLLQQFDQLFLQPQAYLVNDHQAGIRPATRDKQPFLGSHPRYPGLAIMNGFGSKAVLQVPYYAKCLADYLLEQKPLPISIDINRYGKLCSSG